MVRSDLEAVLEETVVKVLKEWPGILGPEVRLEKRDDTGHPDLRDLQDPLDHQENLDSATTRRLWPLF